MYKYIYIYILIFLIVHQSLHIDTKLFFEEGFQFIDDFRSVLKVESGSPSSCNSLKWNLPRINFCN